MWKRWLLLSADFRALTIPSFWVSVCDWASPPNQLVSAWLQPPPYCQSEWKDELDVGSVRPEPPKILLGQLETFSYDDDTASGSDLRTISVHVKEQQVQEKENKAICDVAGE